MSLNTSTTAAKKTGQADDFVADFKLAIGPAVKNLVSLTKGNPLNRRLFVDPQMQESVSITGGQGNQIPGHFYMPNASGPRPAILLLHGSTPAGKQMGLYRLLGYRLARLGYAVLTIDQRGHGEADPPQAADRVEGFNFAADAALALDYLKQRPEVDAAETYLLGHSFGGDVAITAGARGIDVNKILTYGPGRRYNERVKNELPFFCRRFSRYMKLGQLISPELFVKTIGAQLLEVQAANYQQAGHVPLMLVDGEYESRADREFLMSIVATLAQPVGYKTIPKADHYANVAFFGRIIVYDKPAFETFVSEVAAWFRP